MIKKIIWYFWTFYKCRQLSKEYAEMARACIIGLLDELKRFEKLFLNLLEQIKKKG